MLMNRVFFWIAISSIIGLTSSQQVSAKQDRRFVNLGVNAGAHLHAGAVATLEAALLNHMVQAAEERGFESISPSQSNAVLADIPDCHNSGCRQGIMRRLKASHLLTSYLEECRTGYCVSLFLEEIGQSSPAAAVTISGTIPDLVRVLPKTSEELMESVSAKDDRQRDKWQKQARVWLKRGQPLRAVQAYRQAIELNPLHPGAALMQMRIIHILDADGDPVEAERAFRDALELYGPKSAFAKSGIGGAHLQDTVQENMVQYLLEKSTGHHHQAEEARAGPLAEKRNHLLKEARADYELFLIHFSDTNDAATIRFYLAEVLYDQSEFILAAGEYARVGENSPPVAPSPETTSTEGDDSIYEDATVAMVYALEKAISSTLHVEAPSDFLPAAVSESQTSQPQPMPELLCQYTEAVDDLTARYPHHPDAAAFAYRAALVKLNHGYLLHAERRFRNIVKIYPASRAAEAALSHLRTLS